MTASWWLRGPLLLAALATAGAVALPAIDDGMSGPVRVLVVVTLLASAAVLALVVFSFGTLRVRVSETQLEFGFGPFRQKLGAEEIVSARPERYPWLSYGGWGIRFSTGSRRAYSQAFERESVVIHAADQRRYHVTSRRPVELAEAINQLRSAPRDATETATS